MKKHLHRSLYSLGVTHTQSMKAFNGSPHLGSSPILKSVLLLILFFTLFLQRSQAQCYATPNYCTNITANNVATYNMGIQNVTLGTTALPAQINNTTASGSGTPIYFNYTNFSVRAAASDTIFYSIRVGTGNSTTFRIYIDYNNDGTFATAAPELVYTSPQTNASVIVPGYFVLPSTLNAGAYRIRIASDGLSNIPLPCGPITYSAEYEDYTLLVPSVTPDMMSGAITQPASPLVGNNNVAFNVTNISTTIITSLDIYYQLDANTPVMQTLSSISIAPGATYNAVFSTPVSIPATGTFLLRTWTGSVNFTAPNTPANDTVCRNLVTYCSAPLSGTYTINPTGSGTSNYKSFGGVDSALMSCGVSGPVDIYVTPGIYNEAIIIGTIPGIALSNRVNFYGNGSTVQSFCDASNVSVLRLQGTKHITIDSLTLKSTNVAFGWGVHFYGNSDSNTVKNCIIDMTVVTSSSTNNSAGIVFSNSLSSPTVTGNTCVSNTLFNNYIKGNPSASSLYYGIVGAPATNSGVFTNNRFLNNRVENFYLYGIYWMYGNRTVFRGNTISRPNKTSVTTTYAFYTVNSSISDTIDANIITNLYGGAPTNTSTTYVFYGASYSGSTAFPNIISNNLIYNIKGDGPLYGFYYQSCFNNRFLNNTISIDNTNSTSTNASVGFYFTGTTSATSFIDFRNNIISITRTGAGLKNAIVCANSWATGATVNKNGYYSNSPNYVFASQNGVNYNNLAAWKSAFPLLDSNSMDFSPNFVSPATGNFSPRDGAYNGTGDSAVIGIVPFDITGATRALPMDIGAFEASPIPLDAAMASLVFPTAPYAAGAQTFYAKMRNAGTNTITSATINWTLNGVAQTPAVFAGTLLPGEVSANITLGGVTVASNTFYNVTATVSSPNSLTDPNPSNDMISGSTAAMVSGVVTINSGGSGPGVFTNFTDFARILQNGGLGGPVTANVVVGSGPYTEQVTLGSPIGSSATNTITINGNGEKLQFDNTNSGNLGILTLMGTDYLTLNNLYIRSLNASYGIGIIFTSGANYNTVQNCTIDIGSVNGGSLSAGIAFTASLGSTTSAGTNGSYNLITNNLITGNSSGGPYYGITVVPSTSSAINTFNVFRNNNLRDFTVYGFYLNNSAGTMISGNTMWRPTKASPSTFYGLYSINGEAQDTIENNIVKQPFKMAETTTGTFYAYAWATPNVPVARPVIFRNNQMYDIKSNGTIYGFYSSFAANVRSYNNTFVVDHPTSTATSACYLYYNSGTPTTSTHRNNIYFLSRGGTGSKYIYYLATTGAGYVINNNVLYLNPVGSNNYYGYYSANIATFAAWKAVNGSAYDQNSVAANPNFRTYLGEFYQPGNDSVNNIAFATTDVPRDVTGALRSATTPDPGAYEFSVPAADAGLVKVSAPMSPLSLGMQSVDVLVKNFGTSNLSSASIGWQVNGTAQSTASWFGSLNTNDTITYSVGTYNFASPGFYKIKAWTSLPNSINDSFPLNDTVNVTVCTPLAGTFTVNAALPATDTNFVSLQAFAATAQLCGIAGPITVNVAPGVYNGAISFANTIPGISASNNITINGADSATTRIVHDGSGQRATILMNGAKHFVFRNLSIENTAISGGGFGILFINAADTNKVIRCSVKTAVLTTGFSSFVPILSTANLLNPNNAGNNANYLLIDSCRVLGGYYGISLYNNSSAKANGNIIRNSVIMQSYYSGVYAFYQNQVVVHKNRFVNIGNNTYTTPITMYIYMCDNGVNITKNQAFGQLGGYGIYLYQNFATSANRNIVANNMLQLGAASNTTYGIYDAGNIYTDIAHNTVQNTSGDASYVSCALYYNYANPATGNNVRIVNNVFTAPNGAMAVWCTSTASLSGSSIFIDNNVYYSPSSYPFRIVNTIYSVLPSYAAAMGLFVPLLDTNSRWVNPTFFSATNLRSITPQLDSMGYVLATVTDDIDGNPRSVNAPDAGVNEFARPAEDAGVATILVPNAPVPVGLTYVKVVIKNYGLNTITGVNVHYRVDTLLRTIAYTGSILPGATDTVTFNATSGPLATSQRFNFTGGSVLMKAYTTAPNAVADLQNLNDTAVVSFCAPLNGVYTINPAGIGTNNFLTFADAINRLNCGGVLGNVTFNVASGTYTGQVDVSTIMGTSDTARVLFKSATNNAADVIITSSNATSTDNYTLRLRGTAYVTFERVTIRNTHATYGRVVSINKMASNNTNTNNSGVNYSVLEGLNTTSTSDQMAVVYGPTGDNATDLKFVGNNVKYGAFGFSFGGQNIINLFSQGLRIDSNTIFQPYYMGVYLTNRRDPKIRNNYFDGNPSYGYYSLYMSSVSGDLEIANNNIQNISGYYAMYIANLNYYGEIGLGKVTNNVVNMLSNNTQYGIYLASSSNAYFINNTVRCASTSTSTYAFYHSGNTTTPTVPQVVATNNIRLYNNILFSNVGYSVYHANFNAVFGTPDCDNNLYSTGGTNFAYVNGFNYTPAQMNTNYRNSIYVGSDRRSLFAPITFTSNTDLKPLISSPTAWAASGRAKQTNFVNKDITGANRSTVVATGAPDIGAYEFVPTSTPPAMTVTGSIASTNIQHLIAYGDTVGKIVWGYTGTLPTAITATYHTGALVNNPTNSSYNPGAHFMDVFWRIQATGGTGYNYDLTLTYDPNMLGTVPSMTDIKLAKKPTGTGLWSHYGASMTVVDTVAFNFGVAGLPDFSDFTGTSDLSPLPVKLSDFKAVRNSDNGLLYWNTSSEINSKVFEIERAENGKSFSKIGELKAAGNSNKNTNYVFEDMGAAFAYTSKIANYRLKMIDKDGSFEYSLIRTVDFNDETDGSVVVYPNPFTDKLSIGFESIGDGNVQVEIVDLFGKVCFEGSQTIDALNPEFRIPSLNKLATGIYVIKISKGAEMHTRKLIKE